MEARYGVPRGTAGSPRRRRWSPPHLGVTRRARSASRSPGRMRLVDGDGDDVLVGDPAGCWCGVERVRRLLERPGGDRPGHHRGRLAAHRRRRRGRRRQRQRLPGRPGQDLIIVSGFNVFPAEVEEVLLRLLRSRAWPWSAPPPAGRSGLRQDPRRRPPSGRTTSSTSAPARLPPLQVPNRCGSSGDIPAASAAKVIPPAPRLGATSRIAAPIAGSRRSRQAGSIGPVASS